MKETCLAIILTHGNLAGCLKRVSERLIVPSGEIIYYSNKKLSLEEIEKRIENKRKKLNPQKMVFFVDLVGGSCWLLANRIKKDSADIAVIGGVNIPMLVSYHVNFLRLPWNELLEKIVDDGKKGILIR